jgi:thioredoxin-related protein
MIKIILLISFVSVVNLAASIWQGSYEKALKEAVSQDKILYVFIVSNECRWCRKMELTTMKNRDVIDNLKSDFISVELVREDDSYPDVLKAKAVPKHFFLTPAQQLIYSVPGYWSVEDFISILGDVKRKYTKIKEKK